MAWGILLLAGLCEIVWAVALKYAGGFTRLLPSVGILAAMAASAGLLSLALKSLPVGTAYTVWTGISVAGAAGLGIYLFDEPADVWRLSCIGLVLVGIVGLRLGS
ncbi:MAG: multidrug efflux SMR transporter [Methylocystis sp.]|jgi:quaternary ammonium compound-resistance protein SugE